MRSAIAADRGHDLGATSEERERGADDGDGGVIVRRRWRIERTLDQKAMNLNSKLKFTLSRR